MYFSKEDSYFLSEQLEKILSKIKLKNNQKNKLKILDMGSGNGIQAQTCVNSGFNNIVCVDIDKEAIEHLKKKFENKKYSQKEEDKGRTRIIKCRTKQNNVEQVYEERRKHIIKDKVRVIQSNLFKNINKKHKFDLIIFNPPYLPEHKYDKEKDTSGGKKGDETIIRFLAQAKNHLAENGKIILLLSSLTPKSKINNLIKKLKYKRQKIADKKLFFERLEVWAIEL